MRRRNKNEKNQREKKLKSLQNQTIRVENKHWFTDVFAGALLGYVSERLAVNNYYRYA